LFEEEDTNSVTSGFQDMGSGELGGSAFRIVAPKQSMTTPTPSSPSSSPAASSLHHQTPLTGINDHFAGELETACFGVFFLAML
jgi:hypothetical protein